MAAAADIVDRPGPRRADEMPECFDQVVGVNVVANLFSLVASMVGRSGDRALDEIGEEPMQSCTGTAGPGQATGTETGCPPSKVATIFLHQDIGCGFRAAEQAVQTAIDAHCFIDPMRRKRMLWTDFPTHILFDKRFGASPYTLLVLVKMKTASRQFCAVASGGSGCRLR